MERETSSDPAYAFYAVWQFSLEKDSQGRPSQKAVTCGRFDFIESAFTVARLNAARSFTELSTSIHETGRPGRVAMSDTEWGYDVKVDHLTVMRFWVHDSQPSILQVV